MDKICVIFHDKNYYNITVCNPNSTKEKTYFKHLLFYKYLQLGHFCDKMSFLYIKIQSKLILDFTTKNLFGVKRRT